MARPPVDKLKAIFKAYRELNAAERQRFYDALELVRENDLPQRGRPRGSKNKSKPPETQEAVPAA
jgi:hypothetical protein